MRLAIASLCVTKATSKVARETIPVLGEDEYGVLRKCLTCWLLLITGACGNAVLAGLAALEDATVQTKYVVGQADMRK